MIGVLALPLKAQLGLGFNADAALHLSQDTTLYRGLDYNMYAQYTYKSYFEAEGNLGYQLRTFFERTLYNSNNYIGKMSEINYKMGIAPGFIYTSNKWEHSIEAAVYWDSYFNAVWGDFIIKEVYSINKWLKVTGEAFYRPGNEEVIIRHRPGDHFVYIPTPNRDKNTLYISLGLMYQFQR